MPRFLFFRNRRCGFWITVDVPDSYDTFNRLNVIDLREGLREVLVLVQQ